MREPIRAFLASAAEAFALRGPVYRFGGCRAEESHGDPLLPGSLAEAGCIDVELGDRPEADRLAFPDGAARTVVCFGVLESSFEPPRALSEMVRILRPGGALLICAPNEPSVPGAMPGYWRLTPRSIERLLRGMAATLVGWQGAEASPHTLYGIGFKPPLNPAVMAGTSRFLKCFQARVRGSARRLAWLQRLKNLLLGWTQSRTRRHQLRDYDKLHFTIHMAVDRNLKPSLIRGCLTDEHAGSRLDLLD